MKRRTTGLLALGAALALLTGCSAAVPVPHLSHTKSAAPKPTPTAVSGPAGWIYPLTCAQMLPIATLQPHIVAPVTLKRGITTTPVTALDITLAQAGGLECIWGGTKMTGSSYTDGLTLNILPNAAAAYSAWKSSGESDPKVCEPVSAAAGWSCTGDVLAGAIWVQAALTDSHKQETLPAAVANFNAVLASVATKLNSPGTATPAFIIPPKAFTGAVLCTLKGANAKIGAAVGAPASSVTSIGEDDIGGVDAAVEAREHASECAWSIPDAATGGGAVSVYTQPGGAWVFADFAKSAPVSEQVGTLAPAVVAGSPQAYVGCGIGCEAIFEYDGSAIDFAVSSVSDTGDFTPILTKLIAQLK